MKSPPVPPHPTLFTPAHVLGWHFTKRPTRYSISTTPRFVEFRSAKFYTAVGRSSRPSSLGVKSTRVRLSQLLVLDPVCCLSPAGATTVCISPLARDHHHVGLQTMHKVQTLSSQSGLSQSSHAEPTREPPIYFWSLGGSTLSSFHVNK
jgi:hypothetical protein